MTIRRAISAALSSFADSLDEDDPAPSFPWALAIPVGFGAAIFLSDVYKRSQAWARANDAVIQKIEERLAAADSDRSAVGRLAQFLGTRYPNRHAKHGEHPVDSAIRLLTPEAFVADMCAMIDHQIAGHTEAEAVGLRALRCALTSE